MISSLRQRHRRMIAVIGVLLPVAFAVGIAARKPVPALTSLPEGLVSKPQKFASSEWERGDLFPKNTIRVRLLRESAGAGKFAVSFSAPKDFVKPDLIVYWVAGNSVITDTLPDDAILLGTFNSEALPLEEKLMASSGVLILYSLADNEIVGVSKPLPISSEGRVPRGPDHATDNGDSQISSLRNN